MDYSNRIEEIKKTNGKGVFDRLVSELLDCGFSIPDISALAVLNADFNIIKKKFLEHNDEACQNALKEMLCNISDVNAAQKKMTLPSDVKKCVEPLLDECLCILNEDREESILTPCFKDFHFKFNRLSKCIN